LNNASAPPPEKVTEDKRSFLQRLFVRRGSFSAVWLPILAVFTAFVIGGLLIAATSPPVIAAWSNFSTDPGLAFTSALSAVTNAYVTMFEGAIGQPSAISSAIGVYFQTGDNTALLNAFRPLGESLVLSTPYILAGLGVALGFRGGLFNIGAEGQLFVGGLAAVYVGYSLPGLPAYVHLPLAILAGVLASGLWGAIPGYLKAKTGAHEVINTIMMNYIAFRLTDFLLQGPMSRPDNLPITPEILPSAYLPALFERPMRVHWGFFLALGVAAFVYWFLWKTTIGLEIRMVGANLKASRYAGIPIVSRTVLTMALSGAIAGLAGVTHVLGVDHRMVRAFSTGYGFDAIALALLGNSHPVGVVLASLLFGFLRGGAARMQSVAGVPVEIIRVIQGLVIIFVAAPQIMRVIYRLKEVKKKDQVLSSGWSS